MNLIGMKLRNISDNSIWTITRMVSDGHIEIQRDKLSKKGKIIKKVINYDNGNCSFSKEINKYTVRCFIDRDVYANSEEDAIEYVNNSMNEEQNWNDIRFDFDFKII